MVRSPAPRVALVVKRSAWESYREQRNERIEELLAKGDPTVAHLLAAHEEHASTVAEVKQALAELGVETTRIRHGRRCFESEPYDLVVTVGGDGTLLHASHSIGSVPVLAINSAPSRSVGFFCGARKGNVQRSLAAALRGALKRAELTRMQVRVNDKLVAGRVLNDALFCHPCPAVASRYIVELDQDREEQKSSGLWVGPAAGSTAGQRSAGGQVLPLGSKCLQLVAREPYRPYGESYRLSRLLVGPDQQLRIRCKNDQARIYFDGHDRLVDLTVGDVIEFSRAPEPLHLLGFSVRRKWDAAPDRDDL